MKTAKQKAVSEIARILLGLEVEARIPTFSDLNEQLTLGFGTVQNALRILQSEKAVSTLARGHKGTFITELDYAKLWRFAEFEPLHLLLPFPNALEFRSLASGLHLALDALDVRARIDYQPGAAKRLAAVREGRCDGCVVSGIAAQAVSEDPNLLTLYLGPVQYYPPGSVMLLSTDDETGGARNHKRVALDRTSIDHERLSMAEFGSDGQASFVDCQAGDFLNALLRGEADRLVWHRIDIGIDLALLPIRQTPISRAQTLSLLEQGRRAALVLRSVRGELANLLGGLDQVIIAQEQEHAFTRAQNGESRPR